MKGLCLKTIERNLINFLYFILFLWVLTIWFLFFMCSFWLGNHIYFFLLTIWSLISLSKKKNMVINFCYFLSKLIFVIYISYVGELFHKYCCRIIYSSVFTLFHLYILACSDLEHAFYSVINS